MSPWWNPLDWFRDRPAEVPGSAPAPVSGSLRVLTFGFNRVDPAYWNGWDGALGGCERDANDVAKACAGAAEREIITAPTLGPSELLRKIQGLAARCHAGDRVVLWYSGHGGNDLAGDPNEPQSEYLVLPRGPLPEWQLQEALRDLPTGVDVLFGIDACHSYGLTRAVYENAAIGAHGLPSGAKAVPLAVLSWAANQYRELFAGVRAARASRKESPVSGGPNVLILAAAKEGEYAYDGSPNGAFTGSMLDARRRAPGASVRHVFERGPAKLTQQHPQRDFFTPGGERVWNARAFA